MAISAEGEFAIAVRDADADAALRVIESHRVEQGHAVVRLADEFGDLEARIGYRFRDRALLEHALTHRSLASEDQTGGVIDNESLEFLGDAVLGLVVADMLYRQFPESREGQKSKVKSAVVSTTSLARQAERLRLGEALLLGKGEEKTGGRQKQTLLADSFEALIAAVYLDGGLEAVSHWLGPVLQVDIDAAAGAAVTGLDFKSALQERTQARGLALPEYRLVDQQGPDHRKVFHVEVWVDGAAAGRAEGRSKKEAEQAAAEQALAASPPER
jgi:ribonuclease-3